MHKLPRCTAQAGSWCIVIDWHFQHWIFQSLEQTLDHHGLSNLPQNLINTDDGLLLLWVFGYWVPFLEFGNWNDHSIYITMLTGTKCEFWIRDTEGILWQHKLATAKHWVWVCEWKVTALCPNWEIHTDTGHDCVVSCPTDTTLPLDMTALCPVWQIPHCH